MQAATQRHQNEHDFRKPGGEAIFGMFGKGKMKAQVSDEKYIEDCFEPKPQNHVGLDKKPQYYDKQRHMKGCKKLVRMIVVKTVEAEQHTPLAAAHSIKLMNEK